MFIIDERLKKDLILYFSKRIGDDEECSMREALSCQINSDRKLSFRKLMALWTLGLLVVTLIIILFAPELVKIFYPPLDSLSAIERIIVAFFAPPIFTVWGIGVTISSFKYSMLCVVPTFALMASYLLSVLFGFPISTLLTVGTVVVMVYTLLMNRARMRRDS